MTSQEINAKFFIVVMPRIQIYYSVNMLHKFVLYKFVLHVNKVT